MHKSKIGVLAVILISMFFMQHVDAQAWWQPKNGDGITWHWQLTGDLDVTKDVDMYDVDLFNTPKSTIQALKARGVKVMCYFSAGALEFNDRDHSELARQDIVPFPLDEYDWDFVGNEIEDYDKELWLDIRADQVYKIKPTIESRFDLAKSKGCDGVEVDNVNEYEVDDDDPTELPVQNESFSPGTTGFDPIITAADQLAYNKWLAQQAHERGLSIGFKNDIYQAKDLVNDYDWALNEQCYEYTNESDDYYECDYYNAFDTANKAVFGVEFNLNKNDFCPQADKKGRYWAKKNLVLDAYQDNCSGLVQLPKSDTEKYVYRFWSKDFQSHFFTASFEEAEIVHYTNKYWHYEGVAYNAVDSTAQNAVPVYRFWSKRHKGHFYTASEAEKNLVINKYDDDVWKYEGVAWYVYATPTSTTRPVYRFWSRKHKHHFYTASEEEKNLVINKYDDDVWHYEGIAWYVD